MQKRRSYGFTLIELLVVILIIAVLAALLFPAFNAVRENARRSACQYNLKNIGTALLNYENQMKVFPPGIISWNPGRATTPGGVPVGTEECRMSITTESCSLTGSGGIGQFAVASGLTMILPQMGEQSTYDAYNFAVACCSEANATAVSSIVRTFICPSNQRGQATLSAGAGEVYVGAPGVTGVAPTDYGLCMGANALLMATCQSPQRVSTRGVATFPAQFRQAAGTFYLNSNKSLKSMASDGSTNTILAVEAAGGPNMRVGGNGGALIPTSHTSMIPTSPIGNLSIETPWSQGYVSGSTSITDTVGFGSVCVSAAYDAWYNTGGPIAESTLVVPGPAVRELELMYALGPGSKSGDIAYGFTPLKVNMAKSKLNIPTIIPSNAQLSTGGIVAPPATPGQPPVKIEIGSYNLAVSGFRSYHSDLVFAAFGDSSVRKIQEQTDPRVLVGWSTSGGGEVFNQ